MKKLLSLCLALLILAALLPAVFAASDGPYIVDSSGLLTASELASLEAEASRISSSRQCGVYILTLDSLGGMDGQSYAESYLRANALGYNGSSDCILLVVSIPGRDYGYASSGRGEKALVSDSEPLDADLIRWLGAGDYAAAFRNFLARCDALLAPKPLNVGRLVLGIVLALALGFLISLIPLAIMKGKTSNVGKSAAAASYVREGSLVLTVAEDRYVRTSVNRVRISSPPSSGGARGGGGGHSSGGGKF